MSLVLAVIPVRFDSTRFPGKALAPLGNKTLLEQVWSRAAQCDRIDRLVIATDSQQILDAAGAFGAEVRRTSREHPSGTDRAAELVRSFDEEFGVVINIQADEPMITAHSLTRLIECFDNDSSLEMATLAEPLDEVEDLFDPNTVKVVIDANGKALYFSRSPIPFFRGGKTVLETDFRDALAERANGLSGYLKHQGVYAFAGPTLLDLTRRDPSRLERDEGLEQLRALEAGIAIHVIHSDFKSISVDTPADLERVAKVLTEAH